MNENMKKFYKIAAGIAGAFLIVFCIASCNNNTGFTPIMQSVQVTDAYGREVKVPSNVEKVATVGSGARFVVYAGAQDKLVAVTDMETTPSASRPYTVAYSSLFTSLPSTSNGNHLLETNVNSEQLLDLDPDVIISSRSAQECDDLQDSTGIPVIGISYQNQIFSDDVYNSITCVGQACGTSDHAEQVVSAMKGWQSDLESRTSTIDKTTAPKCYFGAINYKGAKSFGGTICDYAPAQAVNVVNVADELGQSGSVDIDLEQLGVWNPDYIFLNMANKELLDTDYSNDSAFFDSLAAFQSGNLYSQPSFNMNGTNVETGICDAYFIGKTVYPDAFSDVDMDSMFKEIYQTMLGTDCYSTITQSNGGFEKISFGA